ncbi:MAG: hypothetical protein R3C99_12325 [Pirellulaceae bacterium]
MTKWFDGSSGSAVSLPGVMQLNLTAAWLEPQLTVGQSPADGSSAGTADTQYLLVKLLLRNAAADRVLVYDSWNGSGQFPIECSAALLDDAGQSGRLVPLKEAPLPGRQKEVGLQPSESLEELLVFEVPAKAAEQYRLMLPRAAFGQSKWIGFELPRIMLRKPIPVEVADGGDAAPAADAPAAPRAMANQTEPVAATNTTAAPAGNAADKPAAPDNGAQPDDVKGLLESIKNSKTPPTP